MFIDCQCAEQMEKGRAKRRRKRSGGGEETGWEGERGSSFYTGEALFEWKDGFVFSSMQLSLNLRPT